MIYRTYLAIKVRPIPIEFIFNSETKHISIKRGLAEVVLDKVEFDRFKRFAVAVDIQLRQGKKVKHA
jgi:hypothetical protein